MYAVNNVPHDAIYLEPPSKPVERTESTTNIQLDVDRYRGRLEHFAGMPSVPYDTLRLMRRDPTISLARYVSAAPVLVADWVVEGTREDHVKFIESQLLHRRLDIVTAAIYDHIDFGWAAYEKVYEKVEWEGYPVYGLQALKSLKNDYTWALYNDKGDFSGFENLDQYVKSYVIIDAEHSLFINDDTERLGQYADPLLLGAYDAWRNWKTANDAADNYDKKISGEHWVVHYPVGRTQASFMKAEADADGRVSNDLIAEAILKQLCASGSVTIPVYTEQILAELAGETNPTGWQIELLSSSGQQSTFVDRLRYLDALKVRAILLPERAVLEGQFGTKAEAESHADATLAIRELQHEFITQEINKQVVQELLSVNFGVTDTAKLVALPLNEGKKKFFQDLFMQLINHPEAGMELLDGIDFTDIREAIDVPLDDLSREAREEVTI